MLKYDFNWWKQLFGIVFHLWIWFVFSKHFFYENDSGGLLLNRSNKDERSLTFLLISEWSKKLKCSKLPDILQSVVPKCRKYTKVTYGRQRFCIALVQRTYTENIWCTCSYSKFQIDLRKGISMHVCTQHTQILQLCLLEFCLF